MNYQDTMLHQPKFSSMRKIILLIGIVTGLVVLLLLMKFDYIPVTLLKF